MGGGGETSGNGMTTTKHPRHRPGCSCIVCIQPPSGKGKHKPTCTCNVCMTVKRRFKTLMMRRKKRQSEREAEVAQSQRSKFAWVPKEKEEAEVAQSFPPPPPLELDDRIRRRIIGTTDFEFRSQKPSEIKVEEIGKGQLDLNNHPDLQSSSRVSMITLLREASLPLDNYLKQKGLTSLVSDQGLDDDAAAAARECQERCAGDHKNLLVQEEEEEEEAKEELAEADQAGDDPS